MPSEAEAWVASLSPWPHEGFGVERMWELLRALGDPQELYDAVHVVGTNGKSTATRAIESLLLATGRSVGSTISPHVRSWAERIRVDGAEADFEHAIMRVRRAAERLGATQFETITAAALAEFADAGVEVAVVEAGLGGRYDATNVVRSRVVLLTNVGYEHTDVLGDTLEQIAAEKLAVAHTDSIVVLQDNTYAYLVEGREIRIGGAREAAEAFVGAPIPAVPDGVLPGRLEIRDGAPLEIRDGAHNVEGVEWLDARLGEVLGPQANCVLVTSILADKDVARMLIKLRPWARRVVATQSSNSRSLPASDLAAIARDLGDAHRFSEVHVVEEPMGALKRARSLAGPEGAVLVTGSLYLLADLASAELEEAWRG